MELDAIPSTYISTQIKTCTNLCVGYAFAHAISNLVPIFESRGHCTDTMVRCSVTKVHIFGGKARVPVLSPIRMPVVSRRFHACKIVAFSYFVVYVCV